MHFGHIETTYVNLLEISCSLLILVSIHSSLYLNCNKRISAQMSLGITGPTDYFDTLNTSAFTHFPCSQNNRARSQ